MSGHLSWSDIIPQQLAEKWENHSIHFAKQLLWLIFWKPEPTKLSGCQNCVAEATDCAALRNNGWQALLTGQRKARRILKGKVEGLEISRFSKALLPIHYRRNPASFKIYVKSVFRVTSKEGPLQKAQKNNKYFSSNQIVQSWGYFKRFSETVI